MSDSYKIKFILVLLIISSCVFGQNNVTANKLDKKELVDSLKQEIYRDTTKFDEKDLVFTSIGRKNMNPYSMLYIVNGAYIYKLDIISSDQVIEFVNEFLDIDKIEGISILQKEKARAVFDGIHAQNGVVVIALKKEIKFKPLIAGLKKTGRNNGDNFTTRNDNE